MSELAPTAADLVARLIEGHLTIAVAESLTGGLLVSELINTPGASATVLGGVVAYQTELKSTLLDVDRELLNQRGAVHPDVAAAMARGVRRRLAVDGHDADLGVATTGVAGPDSQDGHPVGTVFLGLSMGSRTAVRSLKLRGDRETIRRETVTSAINWLAEALERGLP
ncbi:MAG: nicotinamide-nucleotide amidohydrolase family protein [Terrimesophilobacter sp.]